MKKIILALILLTVSFGYAQAPTVDPDTPPARDPVDVISVFGSEYANVPGVNLNPNWGQAGFGVANTAFDTGSGNLVLAYTNFNYQGIDFNGPEGSQDISGMEFLHLDYWTENGLAPNVFVISSGAEIAHPQPNSDGAWTSINIPIAGITGDLSSAIQFKFDGGDGNTSAIYIDNLYFWKAPTAPGSDATLSDLQVDGTTIAGFNPALTQYNIELSAETTAIPQITSAIATDANATSVTINQASTLPGDATVVVVSENGTVTNTYTVSFLLVGPPTAAPMPPARAPEDVISLFSDAYTDIIVDTFDTPWCPGTTSDVLIDSNPTKLVEGLGCEGVEFLTDRFDATEFTHFHMDIYTDTATADRSFNIKFSNWNGGGAEANAVEYSVTNANFLPNTNPGTWISLDIPLEQFSNNADKNDLVQFIISSDLGTVYYDNLYLWKEPFVAGPATAAPTPPARNAEDVISLFSDSYDNIVVDTFDTPWCPGTTTDVLIDSNPTKLVEGLGCEGVDFQSSRFDATEFTNLHMDIFTETETLDKSFTIKLSNWNGGGGEANAIEYAVTNANFLTTPNPGTWISLDIPLDDFTAITNADRNDIVQFIISSDLGEVYYDNLYLWKGASVAGPSVAAPTPPARNAEDVISLFSDAYTDIVIDTFDTPWCPGTTTEVLIASNPTKLVEGLGCEGVDFQSSRFDATEFTNFHMDIYTDSDTADKSFNIKFSNWNGGAGEANALEFSVNNSNFLPNPNGGGWISLDIPLDDFVEITNGDKNDIVQFIISSDLGTVYYDNLYLWKESGGTTVGPPTAAPTPPARNAEDVISLFSDAYTDIVIDTFDTPWCPGTTTDVLVDGNPTKLVEGLGCEGVEFITGRFDATEFTNFHMDIYTDSDTADKSFNLKFSNWNGGGGEANALEFSVNNNNFLPNSNGGGWISLDIPLDDFVEITNGDKNDIVQFIISSDLGTVYYDNLYLWKEATVGTGLELPITLEGGQLPVFGDFNGSMTQVIPNPDASGDNTTANVVENTVPGGAAFAGTNFPLDTDIDIATDKIFTMTVWSPLANTPVLLKLENATTGVNPEREVSTTMSNTWETLTFDFSTEGALTFDSVSIFMNFNMTDATDQTYYWDNLVQVAPVATPIELPITLENGQLPVFGDFNGSMTQVIGNPDASGENTTANVVENTVPAGAAFAGTNFPLDTDIDIATDKIFTMTVWSPLANTPVLLKLENATTGVNPEREVSTTMSNTWETLTFDFSTEGALTFDSVSIFMNFNMTDATDQTYYWDNLVQVAPVATPIELPITLENGQLPVFGDFNGSMTQVIGNPDASGENTTANVVENTVPAGAAFAGTNFSLDTDIDITTDKGFTMTVWSPLAGTPVLLKLENATTGVEAEREVSTVTVNTWETITFDFSTEGALTFESVTVFMNFNMTDVADQVYYWDNLQQIAITATGGTDATLSDLQIDGTTVAGFNPATTAYTIELPTGTTVIPQITTATPTDANVTSVTITQATAIPGDATVEVVSEDGSVTEVYTVSYETILGPPMVAAPTPPARNPEDVISIYSDAYTDIAIDSFDTPWCPGSTTEILVDANPTRLVEGLGCEGIEFITGRFDATAFSTLHIDIYTEVETLDKNFNIKLSNWNEGTTEANALQFSATNDNFLTTPNPGAWISIDIELDDFTAINNADRNDIVQFIMSSDLGAVYYDNLYIYRDPLSVDTFDTAQFSVYPNPTSDAWTVSANSTINKVVLYDMLGNEVFVSTSRGADITINADALSTGMYFARIESDNGTKTVKLIKK